MKNHMNIQRAPRHRGLTLLELLLATAGTGFVATAIAMMLNAISFGTSAGTDLRQTVVKQKTITSRITSAIRSSYLVLAAEDDLLILWTNDTNADGEPNLGEIRRIERHAASKEIRSYEPPDNLASGSNTAYTLASTDFKSVTAALRGNASFPLETWATGISSWTVSLDQDAAQDAMLVSSRLTVDVGDFHEIALATAALRNQGTTSFTAAQASDESESESGGSGGGSSGGSSGGTSKGKCKGKSKGKSKGHDDDDDDDDHHDDDDDGKGKGGDDDDDNGKGKGDSDDDDDHHDDDDDGKGKSGDDDDDNGKSKGKGDNDDDD